VTPSIDALVPLTPLQQGILLQSLRWPGSGLYIMQTCVTLRGELDVERLRAAWDVLVQRHAALRTAFVWRGLEEPLQAVLPTASLRFDVLDWSRLDGPELQRAHAGFLDRDRRAGFELRAAPAARVTLARLAGGVHYLFWSCHHLVIDGWSQGVLLSELSSAYGALSRGAAPNLAPAPQFTDYVQHLRDRAPTDDSEFWRCHLAGFSAPTPLGIDSDAPRDAGAMSHVRGRLSAALALGLQEFCRRERLTLTTLLLGAWGHLLRRYSGERDVVVGLTVSGRTLPVPGVDHIIGALINAVPVRIPSDDSIHVRDWLEQLQRVVVRVQGHATASIRDIREWLGVGPGTPLFESLLVVENSPLSLASFGAGSGVSVVEVENFDDNADPLTLAVYPGRDGISLDLCHAPARFDVRTLERLLEHFEEMLAALIRGSDSNQPLSALQQPSDPLDLQRFEGTDAAPPAEAGLVALLRSAVAASPDCVAVVGTDEEMTYLELGRQVAALAKRLRSVGVGPETVVPVVAKRDIDAVIGAMAVAAAGGAWLPLDPQRPIAGTMDICRRVSARVCLLAHATPELASLIPYCLLIRDHGAEVEHLDQLPDPADASAAYVISTSGSTGQPKLVVVEHAALRYVTACWRLTHGLSERPERILQIGNVASDVFIGDLLKALMTCGTLVICPEASRADPRKIHELLLEHRITLFESVPGLIANFFEYVHRKGLAHPALRRVILGSDTLRIAELERLVATAPQIRFVNGYGLTEAAIESTIYEPSGPVRSRSGLAPIGRPFPGTRCLILDDQLRRRPVGAVGELYLAGPGLARGYFGDAHQSRERFILAPWGERLLRTGDLARWHEDGYIEHFGRCDSMVKVRGFRLELGEVENALIATPGVRAAAAFVYGGAVHAAVELEPWTNAAEVQAASRERLADYMVPSTLRVMPRLPRNPNGKIDRKALAAEPIAAPIAGVARTTSTEESLLALCIELLEHSHIKLSDSFIGAGGSSLKLIQLANAIHSRFGVDLELAELFAYPTLAALAARIDALTKDGGGAKSRT
jgi:amino acid adenylation domain-containing protein